MSSPSKSTAKSRSQLVAKWALCSGPTKTLNQPVTSVKKRPGPPPQQSNQITSSHFHACTVVSLTASHSIPSHTTANQSHPTALSSSTQRPPPLRSHQKDKRTKDQLTHQTLTSILTRLVRPPISVAQPDSPFADQAAPAIHSNSTICRGVRYPVLLGALRAPQRPVRASLSETKGK